MVDDVNSYIVYTSFNMQIGICGSMDAYRCSVTTKENEPLHMLRNNAHAFAITISTVGSVTAHFIFYVCIKKNLAELQVLKGISALHTSLMILCNT